MVGVISMSVNQTATIVGAEDEFFGACDPNAIHHGRVNSAVVGSSSRVPWRRPYNQACLPPSGFRMRLNSAGVI